MRNLFHLQTAKEIETRKRIKILIWAYAYEFENTSLVSDGVFDFECLCVDLNMSTDRPDLDEWFRKNFQPFTGVWVRNFPEIERIKELYERYY